MSILNLNKSVALITRVLDTKTPTEPLIDIPRGKPALCAAPSTAPLARVLPEEVGLPSADVLAFAKSLEKNDTVNIHSVTLVRDGKIFFERAYGDKEIGCPTYVFSCSKSFVSIAIGLLCDEGRLSLDEDIESIFPESTGRIAKISRRVVTVRDLLTMQSGASFSELDCMAESEWLRAFITSAAIGEHGRGFFYNSLNTYALAAIVTKRSGQSLTQYLKERLFSPLGIENIFWELGPEGIEKGGWGLYISAEDLAKVGIMLLSFGRYGGKQILSEAYVKDATSPKTKTPDSLGAFDYGYQIWTESGRDAFLFNGMLGQNMYVNRENGIICVTFAGNTHAFQQCDVFSYVNEYFTKPYPRFCKKTKHTRALKKYQKSKLARRIFVKKPRLPRECVLLDGESYTADKQTSVGLFPFLMQCIFNNYSTGFEKAGFEISNGKLYLLYSEKKKTFRLPVGFDKAERTVIDYYGDSFSVCVRGAFSRDFRNRLTLDIKCDFSELPSSRFIKFVFTYTGAEMTQTEIPGDAVIASVLRSQADERPDNKIFAAMRDKVGSELFEYKTSTLFSPTLILKKK
ncbi:MAG: serine hydrolase [Clostridia bacterium]|nr:serine hydrolase [Clostridia bacterium]